MADVEDDVEAKASVPNYQLVSPEHKARLRGLIEHYRKSPHPFTQCVTDNRNHMKQSAWKYRRGMPVSAARRIVRAMGELCVICLCRPRYRKTRCWQCWEKRELANKTRKR